MKNNSPFSWLALAAIPAVLAIGATAWLSFMIGAHGFSRTLSQEKRGGVAVAAPESVKAPIKIDIKNGHNPMHVIRADLNGSSLTLYVQNSSRVPQCFIEGHWVLKSPNNTIIAADWTYLDGGVGVDPAQAAEIPMAQVSDDPRGAIMTVFATSQDACGQ